MAKKNDLNNSEILNDEENSEERKNFEEALRAIFSLSPEQAKEIRESEPDEEEQKQNN